MVDGQLVDVDPLAAMFSPPWPHQTVHVLLVVLPGDGVRDGGHPRAAAAARTAPSTAFTARRSASRSRSAASPRWLQPISGDYRARHVARQQPAKLAALEAHFADRGARAAAARRLARRASAARSRYAIEIPGGLSLPGLRDPHAVVHGLDAFPRDDWPPVRVDAPRVPGDGRRGRSAWRCSRVVGGARRWRGAAGAAARRALAPAGRWSLASPLGFVAIEAGWLVTECRAPAVDRARACCAPRDAVTPFPHLAAPFWLFTLALRVPRRGGRLPAVASPHGAQTEPPRRSRRARAERGA